LEKKSHLPTYKYAKKEGENFSMDVRQNAKKRFINKELAIIGNIIGGEF
jgi:hypothetical protein